MKNHSKRPDVCALISGLADKNFRCHVTGGAHHHSGLSDPRRTRRMLRHLLCRHRFGVALDVLGESEIQDLDGVLWRHYNVGAFQITMHDAVLMRMSDRTRDLHAVTDYRLDRKPVGGNHGGEGPTLHILHRDEGPAVSLSNLVDRADVGMVETRESPCFAEKPVAGRLIVQRVCMEQLQGHFTFEHRIMRAVDDTHPAGPEGVKDAVATQ